MRPTAKPLAALAALVALAAWPARGQELLRIGYSGPLSGAAAAAGTDCLDGIRMAAAEINAVGLQVAGRRYTVEIVARDDRRNPAETVTNAERLMRDGRMPVILVPHAAGVLALQHRNEAQNLLLLAYSSAPQVLARGNRLTVRLPMDDSAYFRPFSRYARATFGTRMAAIADADQDDAMAWNAGFGPAWAAAGGTTVAVHAMSYSGSDVRGGIARVLAARPDVLDIGGPTVPTGRVVQQARALGFKGGFIVHEPANLDGLGKVAGGHVAVGPAIGPLPLAESTSRDVEGFVARYRKDHPGRDPTSEVSLSYAAIHATVTAMRFAGTVSDAMAIRGQLDKAYKSMPSRYNPDAVDGVDAGGRSIGEPRLAVIEGGNLQYLDRESLR